MFDELWDIYKYYDSNKKIVWFFFPNQKQTSVSQKQSLAKILHAAGKLRIPREVEIAGLDYEMMETAKKDERTVSSATR